MTCNFCVTQNSFSCMTFAQAVRLLDRLRQAGVWNVILGGGEPTAWPHDVFRLAREAKRRNFFVQLGTNGVDLPEHFEWVPSIDRYVLPLESTDAHIHNRMRFHKGRHHAVILDRLQTLRRAHKSVTVSTVVSQMNRAHLPALAEFLSNYRKAGGRLHAWHLYKFVPEGRGGDPNRGDLRITHDAYAEACREVITRHPDLTIFRRRHLFAAKNIFFYWHEGEQLYCIPPKDSLLWKRCDATAPFTKGPIPSRTVSRKGVYTL